MLGQIDTLQSVSRKVAETKPNWSPGDRSGEDHQESLMINNRRRDY